MTDQEKRWKCTVTDGRFVEACWPLEENVQNNTPGFSKAKGIAVWNLTNRETRKWSRRYYGIKTPAHPNGFLFNFCPFCGERIDAPFADKEEAA